MMILTRQLLRLCDKVRQEVVVHSARISVQVATIPVLIFVIVAAARCLSVRMVSPSLVAPLNRVLAPNWVATTSSQRNPSSDSARVTVGHFCS